MNSHKATRSGLIILRFCAVMLSALAAVITWSPLSIAAEGAPPQAVQRTIEDSTALVEIGGNRPDYSIACCVNSEGYFIADTSPWSLAEHPRFVLHPGTDRQKELVATLLRFDAQKHLALVRIDRVPGLVAVPIVRNAPAETTLFPLICVQPINEPAQRGPDPAVTAPISLSVRRMPSAENDPWEVLSGTRVNGWVTYGPMLDEAGKLAGVSNVGNPLPSEKILLKFLAEPEVDFHPPAVNGDDPTQPCDFTVGIDWFVKPNKYEVEVALGTGEGQRVFVARPLASGKLGFRAAPLREARGDPLHRFDPIDYQLIVRAGNEVLAQKRGVIPVIEFARPASTLAAKDPALPAAVTTRQLPAIVENIIPAAGGRLLLLHFRAIRKLGVFDVGAAKLVRVLAIDHLRDPLIAAGAEKFVLVPRDGSLIERWDLESLRKDGVRQLPANTGVDDIAVGYASGGPIFMAAEPDPSFAEVRPLLVDLATLEGRFGVRGPQFPWNAQTHPFLSASPDGRSFLTWSQTGGTACANISPDGIVGARSVGFPGFIAPASGGKLSYTTHGIFSIESRLTVSPDIKPVAQAEMQCIPAYHPSTYLVLGYGDTPEKRTYNSPLTRLSVFTTSHQLIGKIPVPPELAGIKFTRTDTSPLRVEKRIFLYPSANLLITVGEARDQLILRRFDLKESLAKANLPTLSVDSFPPTTAWRGRTLVYEPAAQSKGGKVRVEVDYGPQGMTITRPGRIEWPVPAEFAGKSAKVSLHFIDESGQETYQTFTIFVK